MRIWTKETHIPACGLRSRLGRAHTRRTPSNGQITTRSFVKFDSHTAVQYPRVRRAGERNAGAAGGQSPTPLLTASSSHPRPLPAPRASARPQEGPGVTISAALALSPWDHERRLPWALVIEGCRMYEVVPRPLAFEDVLPAVRERTK